METKQPKWKLIDQLGDVHPVEHGGLFIFEDETGVYAPEALKLIASWDSDNQAHCYRFILERCTDIDGVLSDNPYHPEIGAWFEKELESIAKYADYADIRKDLCSDDATARAHAYDVIGQYWGFENFDEYPDHFDNADDLRIYLIRNNAIECDKYEKFILTYLADLTTCIEHVKAQIDDDCRSDEFDETPGIQLTIATNDELSAQVYQTGDNSYTGSCYHYPHWSVNTVYRDTDARELAREMLDDLTNTVAECSEYRSTADNDKTK